MVKGFIKACGVQKVYGMVQKRRCLWLTEVFRGRCEKFNLYNVQLSTHVKTIVHALWPPSARGDLGKPQP